jgi:hypothetical protein
MKKKKVFLKLAQRKAMKEECRIALEYPWRSRARAAAVREIAERYNVTRGVVYKMLRFTRRSPATENVPASLPALPAGSPPALSAAVSCYRVRPAATYSLTIAGVTLTAPSKDELLDVVSLLVTTKE